MKTIALAAAVVALLAGCSAAPGPQSLVEKSDTSENAAPEPMPTAAEWPYEEKPGAEELFVGAMRDPQVTGLDDKSDEEVVAMGREACERLAAGEDFNHIQLIKGGGTKKETAWSNEGLTGIATEVFCAEFNYLRSEASVDLE